MSSTFNRQIFIALFDFLAEIEDLNKIFSTFPHLSLKMMKEDGIDECYYYVDDRTADSVGPVSTLSLTQLYNDQKISMTTLVWTEGQQKWAPIRDVPEIYNLLFNPSSKHGTTQYPQNGTPPSTKVNCNKAIRSFLLAIPTFNSCCKEDSQIVSHSIGESSPTTSLSSRILSNCSMPNHVTFHKSVPNSNISTEIEIFNNENNIQNDINKTDQNLGVSMSYYYKSISRIFGRGLTSEHIASNSYQPSIVEVECPWIWISDEIEVWIPAQIQVQSRRRDSITVLTKSNVKKSIKITSKEHMWSVTFNSLLQLEDDLTRIVDPNEGIILHVLRERFNIGKYYSWIGSNHDILLFINPYKDKEDQKEISENINYTNTNNNSSNSNSINSHNRFTWDISDQPNIKSFINKIYTNYYNEIHKNQIIIIKGETYSGKTEIFKECIENIYKYSNKTEYSTFQKIQNCQIILEAFGNAKTHRNNNSSRFSLWMAIFVNRRYNCINSAYFSTFLIDRSRVVSQSYGERNFHVFYQICENLIQSEGGSEYFRYLNHSGCITVANINDESNFHNLKNALDTLELSIEDIQWVMDTCIGILFLGNLYFASLRDDGSGSTVLAEARHPLYEAAKHFKVNSEDLLSALCTKSTRIRGEVHSLPLSAKEAQEGTDAFAKTMYTLLFEWLVSRMNRTLNGEKTDFIGLVDTPGFETFENNSLEQLCINFTDEKLQLNFNDNIFSIEEILYQTEQVYYQPSHFHPNNRIIDLIELSPTSILTLLDKDRILFENKSKTDFIWYKECCTYHNSKCHNTNGDGDEYENENENESTCWKSEAESNNGSRMILNAFAINHYYYSQVLCSQTMVFFRVDAYIKLEEAHDIIELEAILQEAVNLLEPLKRLFSYDLPIITDLKTYCDQLRSRIDFAILCEDLIQNKNIEEYLNEYIEAIKFAEKIKFIPANSLQNSLEEKIRILLYNTIQERIDKQANESYILLDQKNMEKVLEEANSIGYTSKAIDELKHCLSLPIEELVKLQLKLAQEISDNIRMINREEWLEDQFSLSPYGLPTIPSIPLTMTIPMSLPSSDSTKNKTNKNKMVMLQHTVTPIHRSLTRLDDESSEVMVQEFKHMMQYMGDKKHENIEECGHFLLLTAIQGPVEYRTELYIQLMKQLTNNPCAVSSSRGWDLMAIFISCFPPPPDIENVVIVFVKKNAPDVHRERYIRSLFEIIYCGPTMDTPSVTEMISIPSDFYSTPPSRQFAAEDLLTVTRHPSLQK
eukprot:gene778-1498_t